MIYNLGERCVSAEDGCFIAESADVIGSVALKRNASVWFNAVVRADANTITIGESSNVQDGCVLHTTERFELAIGPNVTVGHRATLHGCAIEGNCVIGIGAIVLNGAQIGEHCIIGAGALVSEGKVIPSGSLVLGFPGKVVRSLTAGEIAEIADSAAHYARLAARYRDGLAHAHG
jgi:carbonic anhydrase/acetyltransferase-like protein (isoleucine patch superfamily)